MTASDVLFETKLQIITVQKFTIYSHKYRLKKF